MTEDLVSGLRSAANGCEGFDSEARLMMDAADEIERLREVVTFPIITPESTSPALFLRVLSEHEKGQPVNGQDLINALMWRVNNQRRELARLHNPSMSVAAGVTGHD
jgi:hypothetical protein